VGARLLRIALRAQHLTITEAALGTDIEYSQFYRYLTGRTRPGLEPALRMQRAFGVPPESWLQVLKIRD